MMNCGASRGKGRRKEGSLPYSEQPVVVSYPELDMSSPHTCIILNEDPLVYYPPFDI
jgi:hypothetical protein